MSMAFKPGSNHDSNTDLKDCPFLSRRRSDASISQYLICQPWNQGRNRGVAIDIETSC
ncbi:Uncharacterised protein [Legionella pneumophila]|nr:Uncharacterised protein [Legionella pneumophila]